MDWTPVQSSNLAAVQHDPDTNTLRVRFQNGKVYRYENVTENECNALLTASSIGGHFNSFIKHGREGIPE